MRFLCLERTLQMAFDALHAPPKKMLQCHARLNAILTCSLCRPDLGGCSPSRLVESTIEDRDLLSKDFVGHSMSPKTHSNSAKTPNSHSNRNFSSLYVLFARNSATLGHLYGNNLFCMSPFLNFSLFHIELSSLPQRASSTTDRCGIKTQIERKKNLIFAAFWLFSTS